MVEWYKITTPHPKNPDPSKLAILRNPKNTPAISFGEPSPRNHWRGSVQSLRSFGGEAGEVHSVKAGEKKRRETPRVGAQKSYWDATN